MEQLGSSLPSVDAFWCHERDGTHEGLGVGNTRLIFTQIFALDLVDAFWYDGGGGIDR